MHTELKKEWKWNGKIIRKTQTTKAHLRNRQTEQVTYKKEILIHSLNPPHVENSRKFDTRNSLMNSLKHVNII